MARMMRKNKHSLVMKAEELLKLAAGLEDCEATPSQQSAAQRAIPLLKALAESLKQKARQEETLRVVFPSRKRR